MTDTKSLRLILILASLCALAWAYPSARAQTNDAIHSIEIRLRGRGGVVAGVRVRLLRQSRMVPVGEVFSGQGGQMTFTNLLPGEYVVETAESERFAATQTSVTITPAELRKPIPMKVNVTIDLPDRKVPGPAPPGVIMADVDLNVPDAALKHHRKGLEARRSGKNEEAVREFKAAVEAYPKFYSARLELGRELRTEKRFAEAAEALKPLGEIAPKHAEPRIEYGMVLLALGRATEAAAQLRKALELEEANWVTHLYLGWIMLESDPDQAEHHFKRALELDERQAAQAHLSLARLAHMKGNREVAINHIEAYLALAPNAPDAPAVRKLLGQLKR